MNYIPGFETFELNQVDASIFVKKSIDIFGRLNLP